MRTALLLKHIFYKRLGLILAVACFTFMQLVVPVAALTAEQKGAFRNGIYYFNTETDSCVAGSGATNLVGSDNIEKAYNYFVQKGLTPAQSAGVVGNLMAESSVNPAAQQDGSKDTVPKNGVGFGIAQWTYTDRQQPLVDMATSQDVPVTDLGIQLNYLWSELTDKYKAVLDELKTKTTASAAAVVFLVKFEAPKDKDPNGPNAKLRSSNAEEVLARYSGNQTTGSTTVDTSSGCVGGSGIVAGSAVQTALGLAWDTPGHGKEKEDATQAYQSAMPQYNGSTGDDEWSDCGVFIATVMVSSGADPNYPKRSTPVQLQYLIDHPEKYKEIPNVTDSSQLHPGDILIHSGHTYMFVGKQANGYDSVGASLHDHVPEAGKFYQDELGFRAFQLIDGGSTNGE